MVPFQSRPTRLLNPAQPAWTRAYQRHMGGRGSALAALLATLLLFCVGAQSALAQDKKTVAVLEIQGGNEKLLQAIQKVLKSKFSLVPPAKWNAAAKKLGVTGQGTDEVAIVAGEVKADAVVTGKVKQDKDAGSYTLNIAARHGASGKPVGKLKYELKSAKIDAATITTVEQEIVPAVEQAIAGPPPEVPVVADAGAATKPPVVLGKEEDPFEKTKKMEEKAKQDAASVARPVWYPYIDAGAAFILNGRSFSFTEDTAATSTVKCYDFDKKVLDPNDPQANRMVLRYTAPLKSCPKYSTSVTGGVRVDLTAYPLAGLSMNGLKGLGIGGTFDYMFWPASQTSGAMPRSLDTREFRAEFGLRYHWNILNQRSRPSILASAQYGIHYFAVQKEDKSYTFMDENFMTQTAKGVDDHGLPDLSYQYVTLGLGGRIPFFANAKMYLGMLVNFNFHIMLGYGEMGTRFVDESSTAALYGSGGYGPASGFGLRASFTPLEAMLWKGLTVRLAGFYERFDTTFALANGSGPETSLPPVDRQQQNSARHIAQGAVDNYFGGTVQIGYQY